MNSITASERVAAKIRELVTAARITQGSLARALHTTQQTIGRKLSGEIPFRLDDLDAVADFLKTTVESLVTREPKA